MVLLSVAGLVLIETGRELRRGLRRGAILGLLVLTAQAASWIRRPIAPMEVGIVVLGAALILGSWSVLHDHA